MKLYFSPFLHDDNRTKTETKNTNRSTNCAHKPRHAPQRRENARSEASLHRIRPGLDPRKEHITMRTTKRSARIDAENVEEQMELAAELKGWGSSSVRERRCTGRQGREVGRRATDDGDDRRSTGRRRRQTDAGPANVVHFSSIGRFFVGPPGGILLADGQWARSTLGGGRFMWKLQIFSFHSLRLGFTFSSSDGCGAVIFSGVVFSPRPSLENVFLLCLFPPPFFIHLPLLFKRLKLDTDR